MKQNALPFLAGYLVYAALERADHFLPDERRDAMLAVVQRQYGRAVEAGEPADRGEGLTAAALTLFDPMDHGSPSRPNEGHTVETLCAACVAVRGRRAQAIRRALVGMGALSSVGLRQDAPAGEQPE